MTLVVVVVEVVVVALVVVVVVIVVVVVTEVFNKMKVFRKFEILDVRGKIDLALF